jgi:hypothetical protein
VTRSAIDDLIARYGLARASTTLTHARELARSRGLDEQAVVDRVLSLRSAAQRVMDARVAYVERTRADFASLRDVAPAGDCSENDLLMVAVDLLEG